MRAALAPAPSQEPKSRTREPGAAGSSRDPRYRPGRTLPGEGADALVSDTADERPRPGRPPPGMCFWMRVSRREGGRASSDRAARMSVDGNHGALEPGPGGLEPSSAAAGAGSVRVGLGPVRLLPAPGRRPEGSGGPSRQQEDAIRAVTVVTELRSTRPPRCEGSAGSRPQPRPP